MLSKWYKRKTTKQNDLSKQSVSNNLDRISSEQLGLEENKIDTYLNGIYSSIGIVHGNANLHTTLQNELSKQETDPSIFK